jgi:3-hydroxyisobutyrate dehydrogenase
VNESMAKPRVAILGLGIMGAGMAGRLLPANFPLAVYNRSREKMLPFSSAGAFAAGSPREAASHADIIISMVADDAASRDVWLGENGALAGVAAGSLLIESSTLSVNWVSELAGEAARRGCEFLDAPVTGSKPQAASGELNFLVGGSSEALEAARPVLSVLGRNIVHFGPTGSAALMKLINNFVCGVQAASFAEAAALISAGHLDHEKAVAVLTGGAPGSPLVKRIAERAAANDSNPNFLLRLMAKDLRYAIEAGSQLGVVLQTAASALAIFQNAVSRGHGEGDLSAVVGSLR